MSEAVNRYTVGLTTATLPDVVIDATDHDRIVSALTDGGMRMLAERDKWQQEAIRIAAAVCALGKMEFDHLTDDTKLIEVMSVIREAIQDRDRLAERCRNLETVQQAALGVSGTIKTAAGRIGWTAEREDSALDFLIVQAERCRELESQRAMWVSNATELGSKCDTLRAEIERLRAELNTRPGPGMRLCTACKAWHPAENFDPGMACCRAANERNRVYFVRTPDGRMEMHYKEGRDVQS